MYTTQAGPIIEFGLIDDKGEQLKEIREFRVTNNGELFCKCPVCNKSKNIFRINLEKGNYYCPNCGLAGRTLINIDFEKEGARVEVYIKAFTKIYEIDKKIKLYNEEKENLIIYGNY